MNTTSFKLFLFVSLFLLMLILTGCPPKEVKKEEPPPSPPTQTTDIKKKTGQEMVFRVASLDLKDFSKKLEKKDIDQTVAKIKKQRIDIFAVQSIARYPDLKERIDVFEELGKALDMYKIFGENITLSGRQTGNALFSSYPIHSNENVTYKGIKSMSFESALFGLVDLGIKNLVVVSTRIPDKASESDEVSCLNTILETQRNYQDASLVLFGNILKPAQFDKLVDNTEPIEYSVLTWERKNDSRKFPLWYSLGDIVILQSNIMETDLGLVVVAEFKLITKPGL